MEKSDDQNTLAKKTSVMAAPKKGLLNTRALTFLFLWYFFSGCTLFLNKYILTYVTNNPMLLATSQMMMTAICGFVQLYFPCGMYQYTSNIIKPSKFYWQMILVGSLRFANVVLGLIALNFVAVSFNETVKSSAPLFTVFISKYLLGEYTTLYVNLSLLPVMFGLALCSFHEASFNILGFIAALVTNLTECIQNVYSKKLISGDDFNPAELQFYTSIASIVVQIPATLFLVNLDISAISIKVFFYLVLNGVLFHFQSITAYALMDYISPITHSVANTAKRAFLIWMSIFLFNNPVTLLSAMGTFMVMMGVIFYTKARQYQSEKGDKKD